MNTQQDYPNFYADLEVQSISDDIIRLFQEGSSPEKTFLRLSAMEIDRYYIIRKLSKWETKFGSKYVAETERFLITIPDRYCRRFSEAYMDQFKSGEFSLVSRGKSKNGKSYDLELFLTPNSQKHLAVTQ